MTFELDRAAPLRLHTAYRDRQLILWVEPFGSSTADLRRALLHLAVQPEAYRKGTLWLPEPVVLPLAILNAENAFHFLSAVPRDPRATPTTRFWSNALRFVSALASRDRLLPSIACEDDVFHARWKPVIAAPDRRTLQQLAASMPPAARAITLDTHSLNKQGGTPPLDDPAVLVHSFVEWIIDVFPRIARGNVRPLRPIPKAVTRLNLPSVWMSRLTSMESEIPGDTEVIADFAGSVLQWQRPAFHEASFPWLLAFELREPEPDTDNSTWRVHYQLEPLGGGPVVSLDEVSPRRYVTRLLARAASLCPDIRADVQSFPLDVTSAFRFLTHTAPLLEQEGFRAIVPSWWKGHEASPVVRARPVLKPSHSGGSGGTFSLDQLMQFDWDVAIGGESFTREELDKLAESTAPLVKVHGKWIPFEPQAIRAALDLWKREPAPARDVIRAALGGVDAPPGVLFETARGEGWVGELLDKLDGRTRFEELPVPLDFQGTLRPYQLRGFSWLGFLRQYGLGACLADDMGLGKTVQALALLQHDRANGMDRPALLVCPTSVVGNWRKEAARFAPNLSVLVHHGVTRSRGEDFVREARKHALVISSYALVHRDIDVLNDVAWSGVILDEAQNIKNPDTRQARAARALTADYRIALTGTPVENNVGELWAIMEFLNPGFLGNAAEFRRRFLLPIQKKVESEAALKLRKLTAPFILRRLKTDKAILEDLPEKLEMKVFCNLTPEQASLYQRVVSNTTKDLDAVTGIRRKGAILAALTRLKQVCNHPSLFLADESPLPGRSGKLSRLTEMVEELLSEGDRALIFSQFAEMGERLRKHLAATFGQEVLFLHGGVPAHKRDEMVERFQKGGDNDPKLFVLSLKAGGTGLNLTAANHVFHFDRWWNPAVENQATDRAFRIGQTRNVQIHKFVCVGTLEERIDEMIERKKAMADNVIGAGESWLTELSTDELKELFALRQEALL